MMETVDLLIDLIENTRPKCTIAVNPEVYYLNADDAETLTALMEEKMCWYAFHRDGYTIEHI